MNVDEGCDLLLRAGWALRIPASSFLFWVPDKGKSVLWMKALKKSDQGSAQTAARTCNPWILAQISIEISINRYLPPPVTRSMELQD